jgi:putative Holliday junction resolvase
MARILCIDYGGKRTGLAVTDPLQIIATALTTIETKELIPFLKKYFQQEQVELILIGMPKNWMIRILMVLLLYNRLLSN